MLWFNGGADCQVFCVWKWQEGNVWSSGCVLKLENGLREFPRPWLTGILLSVPLLWVPPHPIPHSYQPASPDTDTHTPLFVSQSYWDISWVIWFEWECSFILEVERDPVRSRERGISPDELGVLVWVFLGGLRWCGCCPLALSSSCSTL